MKPNLFKKVKEIINKNKDADISHHKNIYNKNVPVADISHHRTKEDVKKKLSESEADRWLDDEDAKPNEDAALELEQSHGSKLNPNHHRAVNAYVSGGLEDGDDTGSRRVNTHLIYAHKHNIQPDKHFDFGYDDETEKPVHSLNIDHLDDALKQNKLKAPLTTYSGISFDPRHLMDEKNEIHLPAYTSSSIDREVSYAYTSHESNDQHIIAIKHPTGSTGLFIGNNEDLSPFYQQEHLSPRNMRISVNPVPEIRKNGDKKLHIWSARRLTK